MRIEMDEATGRVFAWSVLSADGEPVELFDIALERFAPPPEVSRNVKLDPRLYGGDWRDIAASYVQEVTDVPRATLSQNLPGVVQNSACFRGSAEVTSNGGHRYTRRLGRCFGGKAPPTADQSVVFALDRDVDADSLRFSVTGNYWASCKGEGEISVGVPKSRVPLVQIVCDK